MTGKLDIHPASSEERIQIYRNVFEFWPMAPRLEEHLRLRLNSAKHERAHWYAGCLDGKVVASLGCHPLKYHFEGQEVDGFSIGSVHTVPEYRRRGFAAEVMDWAERDQKRKGARLSSLYSDIDPHYYGRQGYLRCPSWTVWAEAGSAQAPNGSLLLGLAAVFSFGGFTGASTNLPRLSRILSLGRRAPAGLLEIHAGQTTQGRILLVEGPEAPDSGLCANHRD